MEESMADTKFVYTVSGVNLTDAQKSSISEAIGAAVASALVGPSAKAVQSDFLNLCNIHGGIRINADAVADQKVSEVLKRATAT
jgi:uncharacterized protein (DUF697 family)